MRILLHAVLLLLYTSCYSSDFKHIPDTSEYQNFTLHFKGFHVINDCDSIGDGSFFFNFTVVDQDTLCLIKNAIAVTRQHSVTTGDGTWIYLLQKDVEFKLQKKAGASFRITGSISKSNKVIADIDMSINQIFSFPWEFADIDNEYNKSDTPGYYGIELFHDAGCKVVLMVKIEKG